MNHLISYISRNNYRIIDGSRVALWSTTEPVFV